MSLSCCLSPALSLCHGHLVNSTPGNLNHSSFLVPPSNCRLQDFPQTTTQGRCLRGSPAPTRSLTPAPYAGSPHLCRCPAGPSPTSPSPAQPLCSAGSPASLHSEHRRHWEPLCPVLETPPAIKSLSTLHPSILTSHLLGGSCQRPPQCTFNPPMLYHNFPQDARPTWHPLQRAATDTLFSPTSCQHWAGAPFALWPHCPLSRQALCFPPSALALPGLLSAAPAPYPGPSLPPQQRHLLPYPRDSLP